MLYRDSCEGFLSVEADSGERDQFFAWNLSDASALG